MREHPYLALIVMGFISHFGVGLLFWQRRARRN